MWMCDGTPGMKIDAKRFETIEECFGKPKRNPIARKLIACVAVGA